jgi:TonB family protein
MVLLHELAHVRRGDVAAHCMARTALALYWWNPLAWKAWREFLKERELAADDVVLRTGERASDYAGHLLAVARSMQLAPAMGWAGVPMARRSQLEHRVAAILDSRIERSATGRAWGFAAAVAAIAIAGPLAAVRAQDSAPSVPADVNAAIRAAQSQKNYESLENAAKAAEQQRKYETAKQLLDPAVELRAEKAGRQSVEYALGLLKLGDLESKRNQNQSAEDFYSRAVQILGDRPEAAHALVVLGIAAIERRDYSQAVEYLERAQHNDPRQAGVALMWLGVTHSSENNANEADAQFKAALALQDPNSTDAVTILQVYSRFLQKQGRQGEAKELATRAIETQKAIAAKPVFGASVQKIGPGISAPVPLTKVEPGYTEEARIARLQGTVLISAEIGADGLAHNIQVVRGLGLGLDERAVETIQQWIFKPGMKDGQPVPVMASIEVNFRLL